MLNDSINGIELHELIKKLRISKGLTQSQLAAQLGYSVRQYIRMETGNIEISKEAIGLLSKAFNVDIHQYIAISSKFKTMECYEEYINLRKAIENVDNEYIKASCRRLKNNPEFQEGEKLQLILYSEALIISYTTKDYEQSNILCLKALDVFGYSQYIDSLKKGILNEMSYPLLFLLSYNYSNSGKFDLSYQLNFILYNHFKNFVFENSLPIKNGMYHMKKYYIGAANNLAHANYDKKNYEKALEFADIALSLSNKFNISVFTHYVLHTKFEIYYAIGDIENAKKFFNIFEYSCEITGKREYFESILDSIKSKYHQMFE